MPLLNMTVYERGVSGAPTTTFVTDLAGRADSYEQTISDKYGFESCRVTFVCSLDEALDWLQNGLMRSLVVSGPDAEVCWEGFLETIKVRIGQKTASLSLRGLANHVVMLFSNTQGTPGEAIVPDSTASLLSQSLYGRKDYLGSLSKVSLSNAQVAGAKTLAAACLPRSASASSAQTGDIGPIVIELSFAGWYATLDWNIISNGLTANVLIYTQMTGTWLPTFAIINPFLSADYSGITFTGPLWPVYVAHYETFKQVIETRLAAGDSSNNPVAWGVYEDRRFQAATSASATPDAITYLEDAGSGLIMDSVGNVVQPWNVRPNAMSQVVQLLDVGPVSGATDAAARKYVSRVTCRITPGSIGCTLEPSGSSELDVIAGAFPTTVSGGWS